MAGEHDHMAMMEEDERKTRWSHFANIGIGLWLAFSPMVFGIAGAADVPETIRTVTADRNLPSIEWRSAALAISDVATGFLIAVFAALSLSKRTAWFAQWTVCAAGIWLLFAPMIFWAPSAAVYANDMLVGTAVIAFSVLVPMMPGMSHGRDDGQQGDPARLDLLPVDRGAALPDRRDGYRRPADRAPTHRLSARLRRAGLGAVLRRFVGRSQERTEEIITSWVSEMWPVPDAGLGAVSYLIEILMAVMGTRQRWRTMPWMVTFFGILVVPLGVTSIYFIIIQPILLGTWCTLCLIAAVAMLIMIPFALDELIAMGQFLYWSHCRGKALIRTFFKGDAIEGGEAYSEDAMLSTRAAWAEAKRGVILPWTLVASIALGVFLMLTRLTLGTEGDMADSDHLMGALTITVSVIATAEVARLLRFANALFGAWLIAAPFFLEGGGTAATLISIALGLALIALSVPRRRRSEEHYAGWDRFVF